MRAETWLEAPPQTCLNPSDLLPLNVESESKILLLLLYMFQLNSKTTYNYAKFLVNQIVVVTFNYFMYITTYIAS